MWSEFFKLLIQCGAAFLVFVAGCFFVARSVWLLFNGTLATDAVEMLACLVMGVLLAYVSLKGAGYVT